MAAAAYLGGPVTGMPSPIVSGRPLMTSPRLPNTGDTERLRAIPWYLPASPTWIKLTSSIPIRPPHHPSSRLITPIQPLNSSTFFPTSHSPHRINWSDGLHGF